MTVADPSARDRQRAGVYAAESFVRVLFEQAAERQSPVVDFFGTQLTLPPEGRFASVESVQRYVDDVLALPAVRDRWPGVPRLHVRSRRGMTAAHYEVRNGVGVIAVPDRDGVNWALRELVVLHEISHHLSPARPAHGPAFVATMCALCTSVMGPELGHLLRVVYAQEGVR